MNNPVQLIRSDTQTCKLLPFEQARARIIDAFPHRGRTIELPVEQAVGRVLAAPVLAEFSVPGAEVADVDGFALRSIDTACADREEPVLVETAGRVDTGRALPEGADAVVPVEDCRRVGDRIVIRAPVLAGDGVRHAGSEIAWGTVLLDTDHRVRPGDIGPLIAAGVTHIRARSARAGVVPTGDELVVPGSMPGPGESVASNPVAIRALLGPQGAETVIHPVTPDDPVAVRRAIEALLEEGCDLVVVCGGSGRGTRDVAFGVVRSLGEVVVDGVAARPGRAFLVVRANGIPIVSLPGRAQPVTLLTEYFLVPLLAAWGLPAPGAPRIPVRLGLPIESHPGFTETVPLSIARVGGEVVGLRQPRGARGALSQLRANARLLVPDGIDRYPVGGTAEVELMGDPDVIDRTVLVAGAVDGLGIPGHEYRPALVPCSSDEAYALLEGSACHLAAFDTARTGYNPSWCFHQPGRGARVLAAPQGLCDDPKVRWVLSALGITR